MRILSSLILFFCLLAVHAQQAASKKEIRFQPESLENGNAAIFIHDLSTGEIVYQQNPDQRMVPASTLKVITARTAWELLGEHFRFKTSMGYRGRVESGILHGDLIWLGSGDPSLGNGNIAPRCAPEAVFGEILTSLREHGIRQVDGQLLIIDTLYRGEETPRYWLWEDISNYYGAGVRGFNFMENAFTITFSRSRKVGTGAQILRISPEPRDIQLSSEVRIGKPGTGDQAYVFGGPHALKQIVRGTIPPGDEPFSIRAANHHPATLAADMLIDFLSKKGIEINGGYRVFRAQVPLFGQNGMTWIHHYRSPELKDLVTYLLARSDNLVAEALLKKCASRQGKDTRAHAAAARMAADWEGQLDANGWRFFDGSGLSPMNRVSPRNMVDFLAVVSRREDFTYWLKMMPRGREILGASTSIPDLSCLMQTYLKSGSLNGVQNYAGYLQKRNGNLLGVAAFFTGFESGRMQLRRDFFAFLYALCVGTE